MHTGGCSGLNVGASVRSKIYHKNHRLPTPTFSIRETKQTQHKFFHQFFPLVRHASHATGPPSGRFRGRCVSPALSGGGGSAWRGGDKGGRGAQTKVQMMSCSKKRNVNLKDENIETGILADSHTQTPRGTRAPEQTGRCPGGWWARTTRRMGGGARQGPARGPPPPSSPSSSRAAPPCFKALAPPTHLWNVVAPAKKTPKPWGRGLHIRSQAEATIAQL